MFVARDPTDIKLVMVKLMAKSSNPLSELIQQPGDHLNIKMSSYKYRDPHVKDKTVSRPSYL